MSRNPRASSASIERPASPLSQTLISRKQEKRELQNLNDRLALYIERNRQLEAENSQLVVETRVIKESVEREINKSRLVYEKELKDLRLLLDDTAKQKAKYELDCQRIRSENDDLNTKMKQKQKELTIATKKVENLEHDLEDSRSRYNTVLLEKKNIENQLSSSNQEAHALQKQLKNLQNQLETETLARVNMENQVHSLREELEFKESLYKQEVLEIRSSSEQHVGQAVEARLQEEYSQRLDDELQDLRERYENQHRMAREELERKFTNQINDLQKLLDAKTTSETNLRNESHNLKSQFDTINSKVNEYKSLNTSLNNRIKDLEKLLSQERNWAQSALKDKDDEISKIRAEINQIHKEYQDLMDIKVALDFEINTYRKLLEGEETRLSPKGDEGGKILSPRPYATPRKRKRVYLQDEESFIDIKVFSDCKGDIEILDYDQEGKYIKLSNKGEADISLSGWILSKKCGEKVVSHKFNRSATIKPKSTITIWSSDSKGSASLPEDTVIKGTWCSGDDATVTLVNQEGEELATRTTTKVTRSSKFRRTGGIDDFEYATNQKKQECCMM